MSPLIPPTTIFLTVKWAPPGLWESSQDSPLWLYDSSIHLCGFDFKVASTSSTVAHLMNPKPPECSVSGSHHHTVWAFPIVQSGSSDSSVVPKLKLPMKSFHSHLGSVGGSDLDTTTMGGKILTKLLSRQKKLAFILKSLHLRQFYSLHKSLLLFS